MSDSESSNGVRARVMSKLGAAFNRADELGGDLRDKLKERYDESERAQGIVARVSKLRPAKKKFQVRVKQRSAAEEQAPEQTTADAPMPQKIFHQEGLGNPNIAAQIFGKDSCPWTGRAIKLMEDRKIDYDYVDLELMEDPALETNLIEETKQNTVPYVYMGGQFIGGYHATAEIDRLGQLQYAIMPPEVRAAHPEASKISIAARPNSDEVAPGDSEDR